MKKNNKKILENILKEVSKILETEKISTDFPRVGDARTPLSILKVVNDEDMKVVSVVWEGGAKTESSYKDSDFETAFGLCVAKRCIKDYDRYIETIKNSDRYITINKNKDE